jgi:hypothetical protein
MFRGLAVPTLRKSKLGSVLDFREGLDPAEHGVDQRFDVRVDKADLGSPVRQQEAVVQWAVQSVDHHVWIEAWAQFTTLNPTQNDPAGEFPARG